MAGRGRGERPPVPAGCLPGIDHVSVSLAHRTGRVTTQASTDGLVRAQGGVRLYVDGETPGGLNLYATEPACSLRT